MNNNTTSSGTDLDLDEAKKLAEQAGFQNLGGFLMPPRQNGHITPEVLQLIALARRASTQPAGAPAQAQPDRAQCENAEFTEWWNRVQACPEHNLITENAAHAAWQERARRAALSASPSAPAVQAKALTTKRIWEIAKQTIPNVVIGPIETFARAIEDEVRTLHTGAPAVQAEPCKFPLCQSEEYQQALAEQIKCDLYTGAAPADATQQQPKRRDILGICDAYESGMGHGLQRDGHKSGSIFSNPEHGAAYELGYAEGEERASAAPLEAHAGAVDAKANQIPAAAVRAAERVESMHKGVVGVFAAIKDEHIAASQQAPAPTAEKKGGEV